MQSKLIRKNYSVFNIWVTILHKVTWNSHGKPNIANSLWRTTLWEISISFSVLKIRVRLKEEFCQRQKFCRRWVAEYVNTRTSITWLGLAMTFGDYISFKGAIVTLNWITFCNLKNYLEINKNLKIIISMLK